MSNHRSPRASSRQWASCAERVIASLVQGVICREKGKKQTLASILSSLQRLTNLNSRYSTVSTT